MLNPDWHIQSLDRIRSLSPSWVGQNLIFACLGGSHAYGLATPESDIDVRGVTIAPREYYLGFLNHFEQAEGQECVVHDLRKFCQLAADCNPNIIELLFGDSRMCFASNASWEKIQDKRDLFLSTKAQYTFSGYAMAQLKRIRTHRRWLLQPAEIKPTREAFGLPETTLISKDIMGAIEAGKETNFSAEVMTTYHKERAYHNAMQEHAQYTNWKATRNPKRAAMEAKFGYDTKHAMHLVRLMTMGQELLTTGKLTVLRPDAKLLLEVRNGFWTYERLEAWATQMDEDIKLAAAKSPLPARPDRVGIDALCREIIEEVMF